MMEKIENALRETARSLLSEKKVDIIIGWEKGSLPLKTKPVFIDKEEDVSKLIWNETCDLNLVSLIPKTDKKIGIIAKHCDIKALIVLISEKQIKRDDITIIKIPCMGIIDKRKIENELEGREIKDFNLTSSELIITCNHLERKFKKNEVIFNSCSSCDREESLIHDYLIDQYDLSPIMEHSDEFAEVEEFEKLNSDERWKYFENKLNECIRCYACRNACPLCYCKECFVDQNAPQWFGKTANVSDNMIFHLVRATHLAGRCVGCGACTRACPMGIDLQLINKKIQQIAKNRFDFKAGTDLEAICPIGTFNADDPEEFIIRAEGE